MFSTSSLSCAKFAVHDAKGNSEKKILGAKRAEGKSSDKDREFDRFGQNNFSM